MNGDLTLDNWAALSHKPAFLNPNSGTYGPAPWPWTGRENARRLTAYTILEAYRRNVARWYVAASSEEQRDIRREYGDPDLLMRQVSSSLLGRGYRISVDGADDEGATQDQTTSGPATNRQEELARWSVDEQMALKLLENEQTCLSLGDSVLWLSYSSKRKRVRVKVLNPGFYFPVYPRDDDGEDFPEKVHLGWEYEDWDATNKRLIVFVRRVTFELVPSEPYSVSYQSEPATQRCLMTDATWTLDDLDRDLRDMGPDSFAMKRATFRTNEDGQVLDGFDIGIDFIPLLHIPNFGGKPWGQSLYTTVSHVLDDLQMADTDAAEAADVAGAPPIVVAGADASVVKNYGPKTAWSVPTGGQASVLDTSKGLASLHDHQDRLFRRLTVNARIPREILGIVGAAEVPSGTALALAFNPYKVLIGELRLMREHKYTLLFKMVQRLMVQAGQWSGDVRAATIEFGAALPEDVAATVALVKELAAADRPLISRLTGLGMLADVGLPIEDPAAELALVHGEDFDAGRLIQMSTGSSDLAADHLGLSLPDETREAALAIELADIAAGAKVDVAQVGADTAKANAKAQVQAAQANADAAAAAGPAVMPSGALPPHGPDTVANSKNTPNASGAGTGTRNPGAIGGSNNRNARRRRRGNNG